MKKSGKSQGILRWMISGNPITVTVLLTITVPVLVLMSVTMPVLIIMPLESVQSGQNLCFSLMDTGKVAM